MSKSRHLVDFLYQLADDKLIIGHRDSEWLGLCPDIEGDVAFSSIAQDETGHAVYYFELLSQLGEEVPDTLAFARNIPDRRNAILLERPNRDWVFSVVRHFVYDVYDQIRLQSLSRSSFLPLRHGAEKIRREENYHLLHHTAWFKRLSSATQDSRGRVQDALTLVWRDLLDLFHYGQYEDNLLADGIISFGSEETKQRFCSWVEPVFEEVDLPYPGEMTATQYGRLGNHSEDLTELLSTMTQVYRLDPTAKW